MCLAAQFEKWLFRLIFFSGPTLLASTSGKKSHSRVPRVFEKKKFFFSMLKFYRRVCCLFSRSLGEFQVRIS